MNWIKGSEYVLDYFHLSKYVKTATGHMSQIFEPLWTYIRNINKKDVIELLNFIIVETKSETKKEAVKKSKRYILNNWEGIERGMGKAI